MSQYNAWQASLKYKLVGMKKESAAVKMLHRSFLNRLNQMHITVSTEVAEGALKFCTVEVTTAIRIQSHECSL